MTVTTATGTTTSSPNIITSLGAGSGIDSKALANNLVEAEGAPRRDAINAKIAKSEAKISGYGAVAYVLSQIKEAFGGLNDENDYNSLSVRNSSATAFGVTTGANAVPGDYQIKVNTLSQPQRAVSEGFASTSVALSSSDFSVNLSIHGGTSSAIAVTAGNSSPAGIVAAINAANKGVTAQLINTGDGTSSPYKIILTGQGGASQDFTLTSNSDFTSVSDSAITGISFNTTDPLQSATDAEVEINGLVIKRSTNVISDAIKGVTLDLYSTTSTASVNLTRDASSLKEKLTTLVSAFNDAVSILNVVANRESTVDEYGGSLFGDSTVRLVKDQIRKMITTPSSTPGTSLDSMWQIGVTLNSDGTIKLDDTKLTAALASNFDDVVKMMSGNNNNLSSFSTVPAGVAGDAFRTLTKMMGSGGILETQNISTIKQITQYKIDLESLQDRMAKLLKRYQTQFAVMDSLVGQSKATRDSLKSTFESMTASNN